MQIYWISIDILESAFRVMHKLSWIINWIFHYVLQDIYNNPFGDFNNQLISDVAIGKSTEITDMVMQQQPENAFCNFSDTLNSINNNKFNNGLDENNFMAEEDREMASPQHDEPSAAAAVSNDDNNNSSNDLGPETDVDAIDEEFQLNAAMGGDKEKTQMEFKETEDVADRADAMMNNLGDAMFGTLENKIFDQLSLQNPDLMKGSNPFAPEEDVEVIADSIATVADFLDNKMMEQQVDDFTEKLDNFERQNDFDGGDEVAMSANERFGEEIEIDMQQQQPQEGESFSCILTELFFGTDRDECDERITGILIGLMFLTGHFWWRKFLLNFSKWWCYKIEGAMGGGVKESHFNPQTFTIIH